MQRELPRRTVTAMLLLGWLAVGAAVVTAWFAPTIPGFAWKALAVWFAAVAVLNAARVLQAARRGNIPDGTEATLGLLGAAMLALAMLLQPGDHGLASPGWYFGGVALPLLGGLAAWWLRRRGSS